MAPLGIYAREMKTYVDTKTCSGIFTAVLLIIAKNWNQITSLNGEWLNELDIPISIPWNTVTSKKDHSADTCNSLYKSPENYIKYGEKASTKRSYNVCFHVYNTLKMTHRVLICDTSQQRIREVRPCAQGYIIEPEFRSELG